MWEVGLVQAPEEAFAMRAGPRGRLGTAGRCRAGPRAMERRARTDRRAFVGLGVAALVVGAALWWLASRGGTPAGLAPDVPVIAGRMSGFMCPARGREAAGVQDPRR